MRPFIQKMALIALMLTAVTACQKEEISRVQPDDQITLRTLTFDLGELQAIYTALLAEVNDLIGEGVLNGPQGNGLIPQLNNLQRALTPPEDPDIGEANRILEEDIIPHLAGLLEDGVLDETQHNTLYLIATNQTDPTEGTVSLDGVTYHWKMFAGKKWLVENLRYSIPGYSWYHPQVITLEDQVAYGMLYTWGGAELACGQLGEGWKLPSDVDWDALGSVYGSWDEFGRNSGAYDYLVYPGSSGFNARLGGMRHPEYLYDPGYADPFGLFGGYWSDDNDGAGTARNYYFMMDYMGKAWRDWMNGYSCRCVFGD